jgi:dinuclear metal center YbgI/SA1388 family protein
MKLADLIDAMERIAPTRYAESWDNVGLLAGDPTASISRGLLTIDYTPSVASEARAKRCDVVIAYHPPIFEAIKRMTGSSLIFQAIRGGIAIYSPHTALDVAEGGTNDMLADVIGLKKTTPLRLHAGSPTQYKLVTFLPIESVEKVSQAIFAAGAGRIGNYSSCGFRSEGDGTFFGESGTNPTIGQSGRLERASEIRLETVVPIARVGEVIAALRASHPYEEPAFDLNQLAAVPDSRGMGRIGSLARTSRRQLLARIKRGLGVNDLLVAGPTSGNIAKAAVCAGSCGGLLNDAIVAGAELFLTGEVRHHDALKAAVAGMTVVCALHSNSERPVLARLKARLQRELPKLTLSISRADRDPFTVDHGEN